MRAIKPEITGGGKTPPPCFMFLKYCKNVIATTKHAYVYIFGRIAYIDQGFDVSQANLLKIALHSA